MSHRLLHLVLCGYNVCLLLPARALRQVQTLPSCCAVPQKQVPIFNGSPLLLLLPYFLSSLTLTHTRTHTALPTLIQSILRTCIKEPSFFSFQVSCFRFFLILEHISRRCRTHTHTHPRSLSLAHTGQCMHACCRRDPFLSEPIFLLGLPFASFFSLCCFGPRGVSALSPSIPPSLTHARSLVPQR
jgi:hypothetical protein